MRFGLLLLFVTFCFFFLFLHCWHSDVNRGASVFYMVSAILINK